MAEQINKSKLDELLGIHDGQSFDDYMNESIGETTQQDEAQQVIDQTTKMLEEAKNKVSEIDGKFQ